VFSFGHRNIQGLAIDPLDQTIYATEHGALGGDEFNRVQKGANFGWPIVSFSRDYGTGEHVTKAQRARGLIDPLLVWKQATAPSGLVVYRADLLPEFQGKVLSGSLMKQDIRVLELDAGAVVSERALRVGARVRDVRVGPDGAIYALTDEKNGRVFRFTAIPPKPDGAL
jgi:aldose sugar dehydrogenase